MAFFFNAQIYKVHVNIQMFHLPQKSNKMIWSNIYMHTMPPRLRACDHAFCSLRVGAILHLGLSCWITWYETLIMSTVLSCIWHKQLTTFFNLNVMTSPMCQHWSFSAQKPRLFEDPLEEPPLAKQVQTSLAWQVPWINPHRFWRNGCKVSS